MHLNITNSSFWHQFLQSMFCLTCVVALGVTHKQEYVSPCCVGNTFVCDPCSRWKGIFGFLQNLCSEASRKSIWLAIQNFLFNCCHFGYPLEIAPLHCLNTRCDSRQAWGSPFQISCSRGETLLLWSSLIHSGQSWSRRGLFFEYDCDFCCVSCSNHVHMMLTVI